MTQKEQAKAANYIQLLDKARCNGDWSAVPELVRKIRKHAPERSCLALAAISEHAVSQAINTPSSVTTKKDLTGLSHLIAPLAEAIEKERTYREDEFQAHVCLGWIYWVIGESALAASRLPTSIEQDFAQLDGTGKDCSEWTRICAVKASYIKGAALSKLSVDGEALEILEAALPVLSTTAKPDSTIELRTWTELLLSLLCMISGRTIRSKQTSVLDSESLSGFRAWAAFWERQSSTPVGGRVTHSDILRRHVWREYYATLSVVLQRDLPYPITSMTSAYADTSTRLQQRAELKRVETKYEELILHEVPFPRAEQSSKEVEQWVDLVMANWRVLCGSNWQDTELGHGGREAVSRNVLDVLYRAATRTFHSTPILRHLFTVHLAVAEFDLAFKAFDTYLEIVKKGKARMEKTGEEEVGLDDDEIVVKTASECIRALCRYGGREAAEKAKGLAHFFEDWLTKHDPEHTADIQANGNGGPRLIENGTTPTEASISPVVFAMAWRSIGISQAQWARVTYEATSRSEIQLQAISSLRKALSPAYESTDNVHTLFALAMVLAERRELSAAIDIVKAALLPPSPTSASRSDELNPHHEKFARERSLIPLWHLLALLLSARQEFATAARSCEGAFEQFQDPKILFGEAQLHGAYRSEHLNRLELQSISEKPTYINTGIVDEMDDFEKETVLEVKITQLVLLEVIEGPQVAVNASDELLSLYSRLFGAPHQPVVMVKSSQQKPPQSSTGTLRSIKGSIFGRSKRSVRRPPSTRGRESSIEEKSVLATRPYTSQTTTSTITRAPTIQVTNENGGPTNDLHHHEKLQKRAGSLSRKKSHGSVRNRSTSAGRVRTAKHASSGSALAEPHLSTARSSEVGLAVSPENASNENLQQENPQVLGSTKQNMPQKEKALNTKEPQLQNTRLPHLPGSSTTNPVTRFPKDQERRRRTGVLIKVWLLIAGFYRRAGMYEDAKGAVDEAYKLVDDLEANVARDASGSLKLSDCGWGSGKSVEELWGDVLSERGYLQKAQASPYTALAEFELALTHFADHPAATVGLSDILLDIFTEVLPPPPSIPPIAQENLDTPLQSKSNISLHPAIKLPPSQITSTNPAPALTPLGLPPALSSASNTASSANISASTPPTKTDTKEHPSSTTTLPPPHKPATTHLLDRLAARDRAFGLLSALTKLGSAWTNSEAWFTLARAYEEGGEVEKAREVLWWCVELEEARGVREFGVCGVGGYVL